MTSRKPATKRFTKWVTSDVPPTIRRTGTYSLPSAQHPSLMTEDRSAVGGIIKRVSASSSGRWPKCRRWTTRTSSR